MLTNRLHRTYALRGMDRVLYSPSPQWAVGTFEQTEEDCGRLILWKDDIRSVTLLDDAIRILDQIAERFRLAISKRTGCPLTLNLEKTEEPNFDAPGVLRAHARVGASVRVSCAVLSRDPPMEIEQIPEEAARWILTLTETKNFGAYPDEVFKRLYLIIEELQNEHAHQLNENERTALQQMKWVRDFISHSSCNNKQLCTFIESHLPCAVVPNESAKVRFDRTNVEHRNFVARCDPIVRGMATKLLTAAIAAI